MLLWLTNSTKVLTAWVLIDDCGVITWLTIAHILLLLYILNMNFAATSFKSKCEIIWWKIEKSSFSNLSFQISSIFLFAFSVWSIRKKIEEKHYSCTLEEVVGNLKFEFEFCYIQVYLLTCDVRGYNCTYSACSWTSTNTSCSGGSWKQFWKTKTKNINNKFQTNYELAMN